MKSEAVASSLVPEKNALVMDDEWSTEIFLVKMQFRKN